MKRINSLLIIVAVATVLGGTMMAGGSDKVLSSHNPKPVVGLNIGNQAPELIYKDPEGKEIKLSSLRGKVVLIDFWASWCGPCRMENPNVVRAYQKYKDLKFKDAKGFAIYNVSLDRQKEAWVNAIQKDGLAWEHHVSDLMGWQSQAAATYRVNSIPANFLIDANGIIIAKGLRGAMLDAELDKLLKEKK